MNGPIPSFVTAEDQTYDPLGAVKEIYADFEHPKAVHRSFATCRCSQEMSQASVL